MTTVTAKLMYVAVAVSWLDCSFHRS